jgi:hypothetical protein
LSASQALQLQNEQMSRAQAQHTHLLRAMDCFHEGIILLDLSSTSWHILYANDAFREACGMPELLLEKDAGSGSAAQGLGGAGSSLDFWQLFGHVSAGTNGTYNVSSSAAQLLGLPALQMPQLVLQRSAASHIGGVTE